MKKSIAFLTFFIGGSLALFALSFLGCGKMDYSVLYKDIRARMISYPSNGMEMPVAENDTCSAGQAFLETTFDVTLLSQCAPTLPFNTAMAFQPGSRHYNPVEHITGLRIIPLFRYNSQYSAGADIAAACRFRLTGVYTESADSSLSAVIEQLNNGYSNTDMATNPVLRIYLASRPDEPGLQQFAVEFKMETNALIRDTTVVFYLKP